MATIHEAEIIATATETKGVLEMLIPQILVGGDPTATNAAAEKKIQTAAAAAPAAPHTRGIWEKFVPPDYRPSRADPDARRERLSKEHEAGGFDWTPGFVLALMGAATLFSVEKSLVRRQKKDYIQH
ncbi:hypothetical protein Trihar35433_1568 [Trichoderma harzianum]|nr:hypothetical protein Trihar35433_1568 [Trichoderma harzianum]